MRRSRLVVLAASILAACGEAPAPANTGGDQEMTRRDEVGLTQEYAEFRADQVDNVRYDLTVQLDPSQDSYTSENKVSFEKC